MPTRKQRRRRLKERRHEWEEVYVDPEGRELDREEAERLLAERRARRGVARGPGRRPGSGSRAPRGIQPPSWRRVLKRTAIFAPLMYLFVAFTSSGTSILQELVFTLQLVLIFIPFSYLMDHLTYRMWRRRQAKLEGR